ncbi:hypothetical protein JHK82_025091 [Glycine max]|nr:hypothetical protein JHK82_025091 [Glycine max]
MAKPSTQLVAFPFSNDYRFDTEQGRTCKEVYIRSNQMEEKQENIPSSNTHKRKSLSALERKESQEKLVVKMKEGLNLSKDDRDKISELPDNILLHMMNFMDTREAVQTCVLSNRWNNLWKRLTEYMFADVENLEHYAKYLNQSLITFGFPASLDLFTNDPFGNAKIDLSTLGLLKKETILMHIEKRPMGRV